MLAVMIAPTDFGGFVHQLRTDAKLSQKQVAEMLGVTASFLSQVEHNHRGLSVRRMRDLANICGVDPAVVLRAANLIELDWMASFRTADTDRDAGASKAATDPFESLNAEEREELLTYLDFIRYRARYSAARR